MEDILQLLLYLVIVLAGIAGPLIKNNRARKEQEAQKARKQQQLDEGDIVIPETENVPPGPTSSSNPFEEFLRQQLEEFQEPKEELISEETVTEPEQRQVLVDSVVSEGTSAFKSTADSLLSDNMEENGFSISESVSNIGDSENKIYNYNFSEIKDGEISDKKIDKESFNLKKALIYSEILKRPNFQ